MSNKKSYVNLDNNLKINESEEISENHKCYKCIWANIESGRIMCFRKPCVREKVKNAD